MTPPAQKIQSSAGDTFSPVHYVCTEQISAASPMNITAWGLKIYRLDRL